MSCLLKNYKICLQKRPILTKSLTCAFLFATADFIAQKSKPTATQSNNHR
jgi:hypothetical protein